MQRLRKTISHASRLTGTLALFLVLAGGTAWALDEFTGQNIQDGTLTSADYRNEDIRSVDVRDAARPSGGLQASDLAASALGARAYGHVAAVGKITRSKNVTGDAYHAGGGSAIGGGAYCIPLHSSIDAAGAVVVTQIDFSGATADGRSLPFAHPASAGCSGNAIRVQTSTYLAGRFAGDPSKDVRLENQPFFFVVP